MQSSACLLELVSVAEAAGVGAEADPPQPASRAPVGDRPLAAAAHEAEVVGVDVPGQYAPPGAWRLGRHVAERGGAPAHLLVGGPGCPERRRRSGDLRGRWYKDLGLGVDPG